MNIVSILENSIKNGGGFNQALNAIIQMEQIKGEYFNHSVLTSNEENVAILVSLGINVNTFKKSFFDNIIAGFSTLEVTRRLLQKIKVIGPLEKKLIDMNCDLVYFVTPSSRVASLQVLNYILTVWDNSHRSSPEFPEVRSFGEFHRREYIYKNFISSSYLTIVDSEQLAEKINTRYGVDVERLIVMPFSINPIINLASAGKLNADDVLSSYNIERGFFFYPAQFWPHKNHVRILQALKILRDRGKFYKVVFVGGDKGGLKHINIMIDKLQLTDQVKILGFVENDHMAILYRACATVVVPTYFGFTNIPPIEAWYFDKPLIYPSCFKGQVQESALLFDPDEASELADSMTQSLLPSTARNLIENGRKSLKELDVSRQCCEEKLLFRLTQLEKRLESWKIT